MMADHSNQELSGNDDVDVQATALTMLPVGVVEAAVVPPAAAAAAAAVVKHKKKRKSLSLEDRGYRRSGKWSQQEEQYTSELMVNIANGSIPLPPGKSIRGFIAEKLECDPMRVSKKFPGTRELTKQLLETQWEQASDPETAKTLFHVTAPTVMAYNTTKTTTATNQRPVVVFPQGQLCHQQVTPRHRKKVKTNTPKKNHCPSPHEQQYRDKPKTTTGSLLLSPNLLQGHSALMAFQSMQSPLLWNNNNNMSVLSSGAAAAPNQSQQQMLLFQLMEQQLLLLQATLGIIDSSSTNHPYHVPPNNNNLHTTAIPKQQVMIPNHDEDKDDKHRTHKQTKRPTP